jgi:preprotein translocase subunit SecA
MTSAALPMPGALWGRYPERRQRVRRLRPGSVFHAARCAAFAEAVAAIDLSGLAEAALDARVAHARQRLARERLGEAATLEALAVIAELAWRALGERPHRVQLFAARAMLDERLAEMATGEGKTLAAALTAALAALARVPVHVVTVNDYLARRDGERLRALYGRLGLSTGIVTQEMDAQARRAAYACDVTYCTSKELAFDYLRDSMVRAGGAATLQERIARLSGRQTTLRGLCMAIVDEADSVLVDEARVPLVLSRPRFDDAPRRAYGRALALAATLVPGEDFRLDREARSAELTAAGRGKAETLASESDALWSVRRYREEAVGLALCALHLFHPDRDYLVRNARVEVIDPTTGRTAPGRAWSRGLHQMIELKEGCPPTAALESAAQITYQRFFSRYLRLCGMSGTLAEGRRELARVYGLGVTRVPPRRSSRRSILPSRVFASDEARWSYVVQHACGLAAAGRAVLIGTDTVAASQALSERLQARGVAHAVLNARHDRAEAEVVARAGGAGRVTVATSMAGRGTDIALEADVQSRGGLHVMLCQANPSRRIDLQFLGRAGRRGEPGSCETLHCAQAEPCRPWLGALACREGELRPRWLARLLVRLALRGERRRQGEARRVLWQQDGELDRQPLFEATHR